ncbi:MAG TPA: hypothetical protein VG872_04895 [Acidimicrobiia bacterium]|jgi:hypothetical protein|nr:hypothetical protein [Acidimicrobiia bacterium]
MPYRLIYLGLALVAVAAIVIGIAISPEGETVELPGPVEEVSPAPGHLAPSQAIVEIDLEHGYVVDIVIDGWPVTDAVFVESTGVYRWSPSPSHPTINEWVPGEHTVSIVWNTATGLPDTGSFEWSFRTG